MALSCQSFGLHKRGNREEEYEDALAVAPALDCFAIADGATDSSYAALWAQLLVDEFVRAPARRPEEWRTWLPPLQARWKAEIGTEELPWYADQKLQQGASAAFLGVVLDSTSTWRGSQWHAIAVGDCCLFHIRQQSLYQSFPIEHSRDFNNRPSLVGSRMRPAMLLDKHQVQTAQGTWRAGDRLWLMTDALAKWFLQQHEDGKGPCDVIEGVLASGEPFAAWIEGLRSAGALRNDDVTLLALAYSEG